jgi:hypothetical protein
MVVAAARGHGDIVNYFDSIGVPLSLMTSTSKSPFDAACQADHVGVLMYFIARREVTQSMMAMKAIRVVDLRKPAHIDL